MALRNIPPKLVLLVGVVILGVLLLVDQLRVAGPVTGDDSGWTAPDKRKAFQADAALTTLDGRQFDMADTGGQVVFLNFWATWCGPCRREMPSMAALSEKLSGRGLRILAVTDEPADTVRSFLEVHPYPFDILLDPGAELASELGVMLLPSTLILDRNGRIVTTHQGAETWDSPPMLARFERLLDEGP